MYGRLRNLYGHFILALAIRIEQRANVPFTPEKPNKKLIIAVGLVLGGMLAVFIALIRIAIQNRKSRIQVATFSAETAQVQPKTPA